MKKNIYLFASVLSVLILALFVMSSSLSAQEAEQPVTVEDQLKSSDIELPFIDRDSDGINDLLQNGWGLRFVARYKKRQELWDQLNVEIVRGEEGLKIDTDGDGVGDIAFRDFMKEKMNELIDTDGDGEKDTPLREYLGRRFKSFDQDGDGLPDDLSREEMRAQMKEMREWRNEIRDRIRQGLPAFVDEDGNGIPDNIPGRSLWRGFKKNSGN